MRGEQPRISFRPQDEDETDIDLLALLNALWRGKIWIALCSVIFLAAGWYEATRVAVPLYTSTTQLALQIRNEPVVNLESVISGVSGDEYSMNTEMEIISSRELISRLVDELDLVNDPEFNQFIADARPVSLAHLPSIGFLWARDQVREILFEPSETGAAIDRSEPDEIYWNVVNAVHDAIEAQTSDRSYTFTISVTTESPEKSALIANTLAQIYRDDQIRQKVEATEAAAIWLSERIGQLGAELQDRQEQALTLRADTGLVSTEALTALNQQAIELGEQLQRVRRETTLAIERRDALAAAPQDDVSAIAEAADDAQLDAIVTAVLRDDPGARLRFDRRLDQVDLQIAAEAERAAALVTTLETQLASLQEQYEAQSARLGDVTQFERETEATRVLYETFLTRLKETTVQDGAYQADSRILSEATPGLQVAPRRSIIMGVWLLIGIFLGTVLVLLRELMQNTFRTAEDLEKRTGLVVLGQIPRIPARGRVGAINYLRNKPTSAATEAIRDLRTSILLSDVDHPPKVIMLTSSVPGEGKTTQSIALAQNLAGLDKKVLLLEGDIRRRTFSAYFPNASKGGLLSVISGKLSLEEAVHCPPDSKIDVLMGEHSTVNAADTFSSERFRTLMTTLRATYDYIVIDTPPVLVVPDARVIAQQVDATVYVVNWDHTPRSQVEEGLRQFRSGNVAITGMVLSKINPKKMRRYGYGGKYGAYSRYGRGYYEA